MNVKNTTRYAAIATLVLAAGFAAASAEPDHDRADHRPTAVTDSATNAGNGAAPLTMDEVLARLRTAGYSDFHEIEREHQRYEVKGRDADGRRVELYVDARTGEVVKEERHD